MKDAAPQSVINKLEMADWAKAEQQQKMRAVRRGKLVVQARGIFILLFIATVFVFVFNHRMEVQGLASASLHKAMNKISTGERLRQNAVNYEKSVNDINNQ